MFIAPLLMTGDIVTPCDSTQATHTGEALVQAQKNQKPSPKQSPSVVSAAPIVKDPLVKKQELKPKQESASTFLAFKRTEVKPSAAVLGTSSSASLSSSSAASGLTGWAAFGAKTSSASPMLTKLGSIMQGTNGKPPAASASQKPVGLSGLAPSKVSLAPKMNSSSNTANSAQLKPMPPLTLGKTGLSRSSSSDSVSKVGLPSPSSTGPSSSNSSSSSSQVNSGNGGSGMAGNLSIATSKPTVDAGNLSSGLKVPTSQESQLHAMKRLQMVKKKAAQKKLKK